MFSNTDSDLSSGDALIDYNEAYDKILQVTGNRENFVTLVNTSKFMNESEEMYQSNETFRFQGIEN